MSVSPTVDEILACVREQLAVVLSLPLESIRPESRILTDLGAESLDLLDLTFRLEETLHIRLDPRNLAEASTSGVAPEDFRERFTVEALCAYVRARLERANADA